MLSFSLDTNCILALDDVRANPESSRLDEAQGVLKLVTAHERLRAQVAVVAISASERQKNTAYLESFSVFQQRLELLGLAGLELLYPMAYWDITFIDASLWSDDAMQMLEQSIHEILFPGMPYLWQDYCALKGLNASSAPLDMKWKNAKCDVQAFWCHAWRQRDVFVTSDRNFHAPSKKQKLLDLVGGYIESPPSAVALI